ncbi:uncharacterized protein LOC106870204 [Octopus bimaculoides]|uniref:uncharacterized protein LOC106870204 n=1 Tax=Octopus bimaculoides TaxID=37653 RepID=UPI00071D9723|nr:uncharacterized protein LOC106870204 [Octopus bimaculoides]|eukprot:XP_014771692.1 PREDICTED: uncharacterized protein LOC106870204 [Octopus bimaculoides]
MQAGLKENNMAAVFFSFAAHSLNVVGQAVASCFVESVSYFEFIQILYTIYSALTHRWVNLMKALEGNKRVLTSKCLSDTRWSARADVTEALVDGYYYIQNVAKCIEDNLTQTHEARCKGQTLADRMDCLKTALMVMNWHLILVQFNSINKALQEVEDDLNKVMDLIDSLENFLKSLQNSYEELELNARNTCENTNYKTANKNEQQI